VLSLLVAEDLVMAVYLPVLSAVLVGGTTGSIVTGVLAGVGRRRARPDRGDQVRPQLSQALLTPSNEALLLGVLGATLLVAGLAEQVHVSAAVGAFLVGIAFSGPAQERARILLLPLRDIFAATFFVLFGLSVDPTVDPPVLLVALVLAVVTAATKHLTAWWAGRVAGFGTAARRRAGAVLTARGEFSIVIAEIGVAAGLHEQLGPLATAYVLVLAIAAPVLARFVRGGAGPLGHLAHRASGA
jgi:monovalent cation:H+ antiporter-2, CPA2 family